MDLKKEGEVPDVGGEYLLLVEFVHRHLDFHDAELESVLDMNGIKPGVDCHFRPLPNTEACDKPRPFRILSFPWSSIGSKIYISERSDEGETKKGINVVSSLAQCTLIRCVLELWASGNTIDDCVKVTKHGMCQRRHQLGTHLGEGATQYEDRTWKITIHTLGSSYTREEQKGMRAQFSFLAFPGSVQMKNPHDEFLLIREVELDGKGGAIYPRHSGENREIISENDARPPLGCYFGRVLGRGRNWRGDLEQYSLKKRSYLGPTSMDSELSLIMTNLAQVKKGCFAFDPFVGTGSILLTAALKGAYVFGTDIDLRVLRGRSETENILSNFSQYGLPPPELVRSDNAIYHRHFRRHLPLFDAIVTDPPYGIRAGARKSGSRKAGEVRPILDEHRHDHIAQTKPYVVSDVMSDLLNVAAMTLRMGGRLCYVIPSMLDFNEVEDLPRHDCLRLVSICYQPLQSELGRRTVTMEKIKEYEEEKRVEYAKNTWLKGPQSADKVANIREKLIEAAKKKPNYEEKAAIRRQKRKATKAAKQKAKREAREAAEETNSNN